MPLTKLFRAVRDDMRAKGMVCRSEMAEKLGVNGSTLKHWRQRGHIKAEYRPEVRAYFYSVDIKIVANSPRVRRRNLSNGQGRYDRSHLQKGHVCYRGDSVPPGSEQVRLESSWAMWPAPGLARFGKRDYQIFGKRSYGWLGTAA